MGSLGPGQTHVGFDVCLFTESHDTMIYCLSRRFPISWGESWLLHPAGAGHTLNYEALGVEMVNHTDVPRAPSPRYPSGWTHPHEVIILACRNFEGMTGDLHEYIIDCIKNRTLCVCVG